MTKIILLFFPLFLIPASSELIDLSDYDFFFNFNTETHTQPHSQKEHSFEYLNQFSSEGSTKNAKEKLNVIKSIGSQSNDFSFSPSFFNEDYDTETIFNNEQLPSVAFQSVKESYFEFEEPSSSICQLPKIYINGKCSCPEGTWLDGTICVTNKQLFPHINGDFSRGSRLQKKQSEEKKGIKNAENMFKQMLLKIRKLDGSFNNQQQKYWGAANSPLLRKVKPIYKDGVDKISESFRSSRSVSNDIGDLKNNIEIEFQINLLFPYFAEFVGHDIAFTPPQAYDSQFSQNYPIKIPKCDLEFDIACKGNKYINFTRSQYSWTYVKDIFYRNQINKASAWIDASHIYGVSISENKLIRTQKNGKIKTKPIIAELNGRILPLQQRIEVEDHVLPALYSLFAEQHNKFCDRILKDSSGFSDQRIYQLARKFMIGLLQKIVYDEFLPIFFGKKAFQQQIGKYKGFDDKANPDLYNEFTSSVLSFWQTMLADSLQPQITVKKSSEEVIQSVKKEYAKKRSEKYSNRARNLYKINGRNDQIDLFAWTLQRSRDHGIPFLNQIRKSYGLYQFKNFAHLTRNALLSSYLIRNYGKIDNIQTFVGILVEEPIPGGLLGQLGTKMMGQAFRNIRNGDFFWYQKQLPEKVIEEIREINLSKVLNQKNSKNIFNMNK